MITPEQEEWLSHLSDTKTVKIVPYNPKTRTTFSEIKQRLQRVLGDEQEILLMGASSLGISGKGELDIYVPVPPSSFDETVSSVMSVLGKPGSNYPLERARFNTDVDGVEVEVFVVNKKSKGWLDSLKFEKYLRNNPSALEQYRLLKEAANGVSNREYYRRKIEFINRALSQSN